MLRASTNGGQAFGKQINLSNAIDEDPMERKCMKWQYNYSFLKR